MHMTLEIQHYCFTVIVYIYTHIPETAVWGLMHVQNKLYFLHISGYHLKKIAILWVMKAD